MQHRKPDPLAEDIARDLRVLMAARLSNRLEIPTWIVIFSVYGAWLTLTLYFHEMPWYVMALAAPLVIAWQGSLRHEATHGHPINRTIATIVGYPPLGLLDAFPLYRKTHIAHHRNEYLTDPDADPESYYIRRDTWERMSRPMRALMLANQTFVGRMVLGPLIGYGRYYAYEIRSLLRGDFAHARIWAEHLLLVGVVMYYVTQVCGISAVEYLLYFVYPGASVGMIRSFYEHRYDESPLARCVVVEKTPFFQLLFLNNNFHAVHHDKPGLPWYMLDGYYAERKEYYQAMNMSYRVEGYAALMWHYLFRPIFHPVHPFEATPQELALESRVDEVLDAASEVVKPLDDDTKIA